MKYVVIFCRYYFGLHCLASGANFYLHFSRTGTMTDPINAQFMDAITAIGMYAGVKTVELIVGLMIVSGTFVPLALILEFPISIVILTLSGHEGIPIHVVTALKEVGLNIFLFSAYAGYYLRILTIRAELHPIWRIPVNDWFGWREIGHDSL